jgi:hypothetical protein
LERSNTKIAPKTSLANVDGQNMKSHLFLIAKVNIKALGARIFI